MKAYSSARDEYRGKDAVFLDANENPYGAHKRYPDPKQQALRQKLSEVKQIAVENMVLGNGSDEILDLVFRVFCRPGKDKVLSLKPSYGMYEVCAKLNDIDLIQYELDESGTFNPEALIRVAKKESVKMLLLCSPNNPIGNCLSGLDYLLANFDGLILIDEAYIDFCPEKSSIGLLEQYPNLMVMQTLSKAWAMAALRLGILMASKDITALINKVKPPYNISQPAQDLALQILSDTQSFENNISRIIKERERIHRILSRMDIVKKVFPTETNFILFLVEDPKLIYDQLIALGVVIRNRNSQLEGALRISIGSREENDRFIKELIKLENEKNPIYR